MIGILGGMGTQAGLDFCNKLALLNRGKTDQQYPLFILYNKSNIPKRPENIKKYFYVLRSLVKGSLLLQNNNCQFHLQFMAKILIDNNYNIIYYNYFKIKKIPIINRNNSKDLL